MVHIWFLKLWSTNKVKGVTTTMISVMAFGRRPHHPENSQCKHWWGSSISSSMPRKVTSSIILWAALGRHRSALQSETQIWSAPRVFCAHDFKHLQWHSLALDFAHSEKIGSGLMLGLGLASFLEPVASNQDQCHKRCHSGSSEPKIRGKLLSSSPMKLPFCRWLSSPQSNPSGGSSHLYSK